MKDDIEIPDRPPRKRRQLEAALDVWLAVWAADETLTPSERRRVQAERDSRKKRTVPVVAGFTGTREGMTPQQRTRVRAILDEVAPVEGHHGDCIGGDEQFHSDCRARKIGVVLHPPKDSSRRAFCEGAERSEKVRPFLERNKDIVRASSLVIAAPREAREPPAGRGQGTWSTVRYARQRDAKIRVVMPDGQLLGEETE